MSRIIATIEPFLTDFSEDFIMSDTLPGTTHPDNNNDRPGGATHRRDVLFRRPSGRRAISCITLPTAPVSEGRFSDADAYHPTSCLSAADETTELMLTSSELNPHRQNTCHVVC